MRASKGDPVFIINEPRGLLLIKAPVCLPRLLETLDINREAAESGVQADSAEEIPHTVMAVHRGVCADGVVVAL